MRKLKPKEVTGGDPALGAGWARTQALVFWPRDLSSNDLSVHQLAFFFLLRSEEGNREGVEKWGRNVAILEMSVTVEEIFACEPPARPFGLLCSG